MIDYSLIDAALLTALTLSVFLVAVLVSGYLAKLIYWMSSTDDGEFSDVTDDPDDVPWMFSPNGLNNGLHEWSHSVSPFHYTHMLAGSLLVGIVSMMHFFVFVGRLDPFTFNNFRRGGGDREGGGGLVIVLILAAVGVLRALYVIYGLVNGWVKTIGVDTIESMVLDIPDGDTEHAHHETCNDDDPHNFNIPTSQNPPPNAQDPVN